MTRRGAALLMVAVALTTACAEDDDLPFVEPTPLSPAEKTDGPLSPVGAPPPGYRVEGQDGGGFTVTVKGRAYRVESSYSYPHGRENRLVAGPRDPDGEDAWEVQVSRPDPTTHRVQARGAYYAIDRPIALEPTRVLVKDTIRNTSDDVVGIILSNGLNVREIEDAQGTMLNEPTAFIHAGEGSVGLIALNDLYLLQQTRRYGGDEICLALGGRGKVELRIASGEFAIQPGAEYRIETDRVRRIVVGDDALLTVPLTLNGLLPVTITRTSD